MSNKAFLSNYRQHMQIFINQRIAEEKIAPDGVTAPLLADLGSLSPDVITQHHHDAVRELLDDDSFTLKASTLLLHSTDFLNRVMKVISDTPPVAEYKYRALFEQSQDAVFIFDLHGQYVDINQSAADMLGYSLEELRAKNAFDIIADDEIDDSIARRDMILRGESVATYTRTFITRTGDKIICEISPALVTDENGKPLHIQSIMRDITKRIRYKERIEDQNNALRAANFELAHAQQQLQETLANEHELIKTKKRFVSIVSHEIRVPLAVIRSTTETLRDFHDRLSDEKRNKRYEKIIRQVSRMNHMMESVLTLSKLENKPESFDLRQFDLHEHMRSFLASLEALSDTHTIHTTIPETPIIVEAEPELIAQIVNNLITNAVKYSPGADAVYVTLETDDECVLLIVRDAGIGMPASYLRDHLFEDFRRAHNTANIAGTGLGLSIVKQSVELHGGTIAFDSTEGEGTTITVRLPILVK